MRVWFCAICRGFWWTAAGGEGDAFLYCLVLWREKFEKLWGVLPREPLAPEGSERKSGGGLC